MVWNMAFIFHFIYGMILPIDELYHFSRWAHCTINQNIHHNHGKSHFFFIGIPSISILYMSLRHSSPCFLALFRIPALCDRDLPVGSLFRCRFFVQVSRVSAAWSWTCPGCWWKLRRNAGPPRRWIWGHLDHLGSFWDGTGGSTWFLHYNEIQ